MVNGKNKGGEKKLFSCENILRLSWLRKITKREKKVIFV